MRSLAAAAAVLVMLTGCAGGDGDALDECLAQEKVLTQLEIARDDLSAADATQLMLDAAAGCHEEAGRTR